MASQANATVPPVTADQLTAVAQPIPTAQASSAAGTITLRFMRFAGDAWIHDHVFADQFMKANPNIIVKGEDIIYDEMFKKCLALGATGDLADVYAGHNIWSPYLAYEGLALDLDPMVKTYPAETKFDDFFPSVIADARHIGVEGKLYWFPTVVHPAGNAIIMFNKSLMAKAGVEPPASSDWTINDYEAVVRKAADPKNGIFGTSVVVSHPLYTQQFTRTWGAYPDKPDTTAWLLSEDGKKQQLSSPPVKQGLEWYWKLIKDGLVPTSSQTQALQGTGVDMFTAGRMVTEAGTVGAPAGIRDKIAGRFEIYAVLWPKGPHGARGSCLSYNTQSIYSKTKYPDQSFHLVNELTGPLAAFYSGYSGKLHCMARHSAWFNPLLWQRFPVMKDAAYWFQSGIDPFPQPWNLRFVEWQDAWGQNTSKYLDAKENWDQMYPHTQKACQDIIDKPLPSKS